MSQLWTWLAAPRQGWQLALFLLGALIIGALFLGMLTAVPPRYRKSIVAGVTFVGGLFLSLEFLIPVRCV